LHYTDNEILTLFKDESHQRNFIIFKTKKRANFLSIHSIEYQLAKSLESDIYFQADQIQLKLQKAILTLPEKQRIVFNLRYYDEMGFGIICLNYMNECL